MPQLLERQPLCKIYTSLKTSGANRIQNSPFHLANCPHLYGVLFSFLIIFALTQLLSSMRKSRV